MRNENVEDFEIEQVNDAQHLAKRQNPNSIQHHSPHHHYTPHHLPPLSPSKIPNQPELMQSDSFEEGEEMLVEDFNGNDNMQHNTTNKEYRGHRDLIRNVGVPVELNYETSWDKLRENRFEEETYVTYQSHGHTNVDPVMKSDFSVPPVLARETSGERNRFNVTLDFEHVPSPSTHRLQSGFKIIDKTYNMKICDDFRSDEQNESTFVDNSLDPELVNLTRNFSLSDDCVLANCKSSFKTPSDMILHRGSNSFNLTSDLDYCARSSKFCLNEGLKWSASRKINVVGETECSADANRPKYSIPDVKNVDLKNCSKFTIPTYSSALVSKKNGSFSIPDYSKYKKSTNRNSKFKIYNKLKTFKNKAKHSIPASFNRGWGFTWFSIPKIPGGIRKTRAKIKVCNDFIFPPHKTNFILPRPISNDPLHDEVGCSFPSKHAKFSIPEPGELLNDVKTVSIFKDPEGTFKFANIKDYTKDYNLIDLTRNFKLYIDCTLVNLNREHDFNDLEIELDGSQISI